MHTRARTKRQQRHTGARSQSHRDDKASGDQRREATYIRVPSPPRPSPERDFSGWLECHEFKRDGDTWIRCDGPEELSDHIESESKRRSFFYDNTTRKGEPVRMRRKAETPTEILTTTFPPWLSDWCAFEASNGRSDSAKKKLAQIRNRWADKTAARLEPIRYILGLSFHADTSDPHFDFTVSRQSGDGQRRGEKSGLGFVGDWAIGTDRQVRCGAIISRGKRSNLNRTVANFRHRYGDDAVPLDVAMARDLDAIAAEIIGPELETFAHDYANRVPELERAHAAAALAALQAARDAITGKPETAQPTAPEPEPPHKGPRMTLPV